MAPLYQNGAGVRIHERRTVLNLVLGRGRGLGLGADRSMIRAAFAHPRFHVKDAFVGLNREIAHVLEGIEVRKELAADRWVIELLNAQEKSAILRRSSGV